MERKLRKCAVCGTEYNFCPRCDKDKDKPLFYFTFCSENCKNIYDITSKFEDNKITAVDAKLKLDNLDLSKQDNFSDSYKVTIAKINASLPVASIPLNLQLEPIEEMIELEENETNTEEPEVFSDYYKKPKKRAKNNVE